LVRTYLIYILFLTTIGYAKGEDFIYPNNIVIHNNPPFFIFKNNFFYRDKNYKTQYKCIVYHNKSEKSYILNPIVIYNKIYGVFELPNKLLCNQKYEYKIYRIQNGFIEKYQRDFIRRFPVIGSFSLICEKKNKKSFWKNNPILIIVNTLKERKKRENRNQFIMLGAGGILAIGIGYALSEINGNLWWEKALHYYGYIGIISGGIGILGSLYIGISYAFQ